MLVIERHLSVGRHKEEHIDVLDGYGICDAGDYGRLSSGQYALLPFVLRLWRLSSLFLCLTGFPGGSLGWRSGPIVDLEPSGFSVSR
jgi:hypothetical protein